MDTLTLCLSFIGFVAIFFVSILLRKNKKEWEMLVIFTNLGLSSILLFVFVIAMTIIIITSVKSNSIMPIIYFIIASAIALFISKIFKKIFF